MAMKLLRLVAMMASVLLMQPAIAAPAASEWDKPAEALAEQIAVILGPGQAQLTLRNVSSISLDEIPAIRRLLEQALKAHSIAASGVESANSIRVTLSENARERLWVAEVIQGNETRVTMVHVDPAASRPIQTSAGLTLRKQTVLMTKAPVLAMLEEGATLVVVEPEEIVFYTKAPESWREQKRAAIGQRRPLSRDPRAVILPSPGGDSFEIALPGVACSGTLTDQSSAGPQVHCHESDDPWQITRSPSQSSTGAAADVSGPTIKAFYNAARDYFTGVVTPSLGVDLPPFYTAAQFPHSSGTGLLTNGIDGKVQVLGLTGLKPVSGTRDWGSDFAALESGCIAGTQNVASGSGEAANDSLRAYEIPAQEAMAASAPLAMDGTITALWSAPDGKSLFATVRTTTGNYEVDRVSASCN